MNKTFDPTWDLFVDQTNQEFVEQEKELDITIKELCFLASGLFRNSTSTNFVTFNFILKS